MALLNRLAIAALTLAGCYSPELRDCAVACTSAADCAGDQVCSDDQLCVSPDLASQCSELLDAGEAHDAAIPPDSSAMVDLRVEVAGKGRIDLSTGASCDDSAPMHICTFSVERNAALVLTAVPDASATFERWESLACGGQDATCDLTPALPLTAVKGKFKD
ncbi:MAG: hypothetical protein ABI867_07905 [Kofleriaceae bacterium]